MQAIALRKIAYARSGDKGNHANVGVIAYTEQGYDYLAKILTKERVASFFQSLGMSAVERYDLPNLLAFNFMLYGALAGGGSSSLRLDSQGKALGQVLLDLQIDIPDDVLINCLKKPGV